VKKRLGGGGEDGNERKKRERVICRKKGEIKRA
jgi:hypothetical protein